MEWSHHCGTAVCVMVSMLAVVVGCCVTVSCARFSVVSTQTLTLTLLGLQQVHQGPRGRVMGQRAVGLGSRGVEYRQHSAARV